MPALVISVNSTLSVFSGGVSLAMCAAIASPSLSGSVAIRTRGASTDLNLISSINFFRYDKGLRLILKSFSISIPSSFDGRSLI